MTPVSRLRISISTPGMIASDGSVMEPWRLAPTVWGKAGKIVRSNSESNPTNFGMARFYRISSLGRSTVLEQSYGLFVGAWKVGAGKAQSVSKRRTLDHFLRALIMSGKLHSQRQVGRVLEHHARHGNSPIVPLSHRMT